MDESAQIEERSQSPVSEPEANADSTPVENRRKSGRTTRRPELFSQEAHSFGSSSKRKRDGRHDEDESDVSGSDDEDDEDDEPDEEELKEKRKAKKNKGGVRNTGKKKDAKAQGSHAAKKPKIAGNGIGKELALRPAINGKRVAAKPRRVRPRASQFAGEEGLYAEVFARGHTPEAAAAEWLTKYEQHNINAMCDLVNFILRCTGTDQKVDVHDIEDVDNVASKITDLQDEYQAQSITEYPLISKVKKYRAFQPTLVEFFEALVQTIHSSSVLYSDMALMENIQVWITSMSSASIRPFRHTATVISLAIATALCGVAREVTAGLSNSRKQLEGEKKKKSVNKGRVGAMEKKVEESEKKLETIDAALRDSFDTVFVHRYRDVDPKIRAECMIALGKWINTYREMFFEGQYLRYLGWILSDTVAHTRAVVVEQLHGLFENKDNIAGLRAFTDRFRPRIVEMADRDVESSIRAAAVELVDLIRDAGMLEPEDVDTVGRLVFDTEARVRKAAGKFFVANIQDAYDDSTEELGDELNEAFPDDSDDNFETPKRSWIKFRCLADIIQSYDEQEAELKMEGRWDSREALAGLNLDSRYALATEAIFPYFEELEQWESLAGFLLYDHSQIAETTDEDDAAGAIKSLYKLKEGQEVILLEVLACAVKLRIVQVAKSDIDKRGRKIKQLTDQIPELQEEVAHGLATIVPQLLNKFGADPESASAVLRLEHLVDLRMIEDMQKDAAAYSDLLNDINKQFLTHSDQDVLAEATVAFLHARTSDELKEAIEGKIQELWDDTLEVLRNLAQNKDFGTAKLSASALRELSNTLMRISNLASVSDCTSMLEAVPAAPKKQKQEAPVDILLQIAKRGLREDTDEEIDELERDIITNDLKTLLFYFMWKIQPLTASLAARDSSLESGFFDDLAARREDFVSSLTSIMQQRQGLDDIRLAATLTLLDLQVAFGTLRRAGQAAKGSLPAVDDEVAMQAQSLIQEISPDTKTLITRIHDTAERTFAKKSRRKLEVAEDDAPVDDSDVEAIPSEDENDNENADEEEQEANRVRGVLIAEQKLCELTGKMVLAIIGRVLDASGQQRGKLKQKLLHNKTRLGPNYKEVLTYLEGTRSGAAKRAPLSKSKGKEPLSGDGAKRTASGELKYAERVDDDDDDEAEPEPEVEVEADGEPEAMNVDEDGEEDLRARELVEDPIEDDEDGDGHGQNARADADDIEDEDEVMGD